MRLERLPLTYDECRARFRHAASTAGLEVTSHPIAARGSEGQCLTIDVVGMGNPEARRMLMIMSGVHGVEGFIGSALQCDLISRWGETTVPDDVGVLLVHAVNPWGMSWWRRQNESNVDLNRNWRRDELSPIHNDAYDEVHALACPDTATMPSIDSLVVAAAELVSERGLAWVRDAITSGQYRHADGLHFGGDRTEESTAIVQRLVTERLGTAERVLTIDLHTGHGPRGEVTFLSDAAPGCPQDRFLCDVVRADRVEATTANPDATTGLKSGQVANGIAQLLDGARCYASSVEFGTTSDEEQIVATYLDQWVHRRGDRRDPDHAAAIWAYRNCFTPDDPLWEAESMAAGRRHLDAAVAAVAGWDASWDERTDVVPA